jgi:hypothetical protein
MYASPRAETDDKVGIVVRKLVLSWDDVSGMAFMRGKKAFRSRGTPKMKELVMRDSTKF